MIKRILFPLVWAMLSVPLWAVPSAPWEYNMHQEGNAERPAYRVKLAYPVFELKNPKLYDRVNDLAYSLYREKAKRFESNLPHPAPHNARGVSLTGDYKIAFENDRIASILYTSTTDLGKGKFAVQESRLISLVEGRRVELGQLFKKGYADGLSKLCRRRLTQKYPGWDAREMEQFSDPLNLTAPTFTVSARGLTLYFPTEPPRPLTLDWNELAPLSEASALKRFGLRPKTP